MNLETLEIRTLLAGIDSLEPRSEDETDARHEECERIYRANAAAGHDETHIPTWSKIQCNAPMDGYLDYYDFM